jgi:uncharacterized membrane protein
MRSDQMSCVRHVIHSISFKCAKGRQEAERSVELGTRIVYHAVVKLTHGALDSGGCSFQIASKPRRISALTSILYWAASAMRVGLKE